MKIDIVFTLENEDVIKAVDYLLAMHEEFPGCLGDGLPFFQRVKAGGFDSTDLLTLHDPVELAQKGMSNYLQLQKDVSLSYDDEDRISTNIGAAEAIKKIFDEFMQAWHYHADIKTTKLLDLFMKDAKKWDDMEGCAFSLFSSVRDMKI